MTALPTCKGIRALRVSVRQHACKPLLAAWQLASLREECVSAYFHMS